MFFTAEPFSQFCPFFTLTFPLYFPSFSSLHPSPLLPLYKYFQFYILLCMYKNILTLCCIPHDSCQMDAEERIEFPRKWNCMWFWATMSVLAIKPGTSGKAPRVLNCCYTSSDTHIMVYIILYSITSCSQIWKRNIK